MPDSLKIDGHKMNYHPERVAGWLKGEQIYPIYIEIGLTSACNHRCIFCALDFTGYKGVTIDTKTMLDSISDMAKCGVKSIMYGGEGEPTLHKDFAEIVEHTKKSGIDVALTTNGVLFSKKMAEKVLPHLSWVKFSVDAGTKETYAKIHGTRPEDFGKLMQNIADCVEIKKNGNYPVKIGVQAILINENASEMLTLANQVKNLGVDYLAIKPYSQHPDSSKSFRLDYRRFENLSGPVQALSSKRFDIIFRLETMSRSGQRRVYKECYGLPFFALLDAAGNILPCSMFYGKKDFYYGNIHTSSFSKIWNSEGRKKVLEKIKRTGIESCRENCRLESVNLYLHDIRNPPEHVNFI